MKFSTAYLKANYPFDKTFHNDETVEYSIQHPISKAGVLYFIVKDSRGNLYSYPNIEGQKALPREVEKQIAPIYNEYASTKIHLSNKRV